MIKKITNITIVVAALAALAACGSSPQRTAPAAATWAAQNSPTPALPACSTVFVPGKPINDKQAQEGCLDPDEGIQIVGGFRCNDGSHLYSIEPATGAKRGWGFGGQAFHQVTGQVAADAGYAKAYEKCTS